LTKVAKILHGDDALNKNNPFYNCLIYNVFLLILIGFGVWYFKSAWSFLGLIVIQTVEFKK